MKKITSEIAASEISQKTFSYVGLTTICTVVLKNGWHETGTSCCANPADYNKELGEKYAYEEVVGKIIEKLSFLEVQGAYTKKQNTVILDMPSGITGGKFPTDSIANTPWTKSDPWTIKPQTSPWDNISVPCSDQPKIVMYGDTTRRTPTLSTMSV